MNLVGKWIYALKVKSWPKLLVPFFLGQCFGIVSKSHFDFFIFLEGSFFTICLLGYIVLLNDYADIKVDTIKRELFPNDCSPKTIPDQILNAKSVLGVGLFFGLLSFLISLSLEYQFHKQYVSLFSLLCLFVFVIYSLPPIQLNYRGGGEFLEMIGVGTMLPLFHFYLQAGLTYEFEFLFYIGIFTILSFTSALASGMSDEVSDKLGGKTTFVTVFGNEFVTKTISILLILSFILLVYFFYLYQSFYTIPISLLVLAFYIFHFYKILSLAKKAKTNQFLFQNIYKTHLHKLIWGTSLFVALIRIFPYIFVWGKL